MKHLKALTILIAAAVAVAANAQDSFDRYCAKIQILQDRKVQNEVGITEAQRTKMNQFASAHQQKLVAYNKSLAGKQPNINVLQGYMNEINTKVQSLMTGKQIIRLRELNLQAAGLSGLNDEVVAKRIGMSTAQLTKFRSTFQAGGKSASDILQKAIAPIQKKYEPKFAPFRGHEKEKQKELQALQQAYFKEAQAAQNRVKPSVITVTKQTEAKLLAILTPTQKSTWASLKGKPFVPK